MSKHVTHYRPCIISLCICIAVIISGCFKELDSATTTESTSTPTSYLNVFDFVIVGKTSAYEVYNAMPRINAAKIIPGGLLLEYVVQNGKYVHITFQGNDQGEEPNAEELIVSAIEEVSESINNAKSEKKYYSMEDFQSVVVGESTDWDVFRIAPSEPFIATSYGALCEFPMEDGRYIQIKFLGSEMIVGSVEVVEESAVVGQGDGSPVSSETDSIDPN